MQLKCSNNKINYSIWLLQIFIEYTISCDDRRIKSIFDFEGYCVFLIFNEDNAWSVSIIKMFIKCYGN